MLKDNLKKLYDDTALEKVYKKNKYVKQWVVRNLMNHSNCYIGRANEVNETLLERELKAVKIKATISNTGEYIIIYV